MCPFCGNTTVFFDVVEKYVRIMTFDGEIMEMVDNEIVRYGKIYRCCNCHKIVSDYVTKPDGDIK